MPEDDSDPEERVPGPTSEECRFGYDPGDVAKDGTTALPSDKLSRNNCEEKSRSEHSSSDFSIPEDDQPIKNWHKSGGKEREKITRTRRSYKPIAPYPVVEKQVQRLVNPSVNSIYIVKIEDEQLRVNGEDDKCQYFAEFQNFKRSSCLLTDLEDFTKSKSLEKKEDAKLKCYRCFNCLFMTLNKESLNYHLGKKGKCFNNNETFHCPGCKNIFYYPAPFKMHLVHDHKMSQKEAKTVVENGTKTEIEIEVDPHVAEKEKSCWTTFETVELNVGEKGNKRPTLLETYLDEIGSKGDCNDPPPLNRNGSDLLENAFNFAAPPPVRPSAALENSENHIYIGMADVFEDGRNHEEYKGNESHRFGVEQDAVTNYLTSQVDEIPVINLDENGLNKTSEEILPRETGAEFSPYRDDDEEDDEVETGGVAGDGRLPEEEKKKSKRLSVGYRCDINGCKVRLQSEKNIRYHRRCHEGTLYNCPECCKDCSTWVSLSSHLWQAHKIDMELYKCDQCPYKTPSYSRLTNIHRGIHGKARPFLCDICGKGFKTVKQMRNHKNIHKAKMVRMSVCHCEICGRTVADKRQLELHINNTHKKKKPFLCYMCGYASAVKHSLVVHMRRHTGEKPYKCEKCEYKTADHNALRRHKMKHTGARNYKCNHCSYTCIQASTYKVHIKTKHPGTETDVIFSCGQCNFQTLNRGSFLSHTSEHENYNGEIRKQTRNHQSKPTAVQRNHEYYEETERVDFVGPIISERVVETIVDLSGAQSLLEDDYYEVERITGDLEEAQELKFKTPVIT